ncbi:MAG: I78 family peptidase inhibitor [Amaricoccus sp.]|uniref:I78 family peptidase inhibitor n=1 Tax=Amaricoccus sp. TaxID=1872485 RepID=UPI0039E2B21B
MSLRIALALPVLLALAACDTGAAPAVGDAAGDGIAFPVADDTCGASHLQGLVGQQASAANGAAFTGAFRVLYPGESGGPMFRSERTTVRIDDANRIAKVQCG